MDTESSTPSNNNNSIESNNDPGKMFIGGLSWQTQEETLRKYFETFGEVKEAMVLKDITTRRSRGFGFVTFTHPSTVDKVLESGPHVLDDKQVDPKVAFPRKSHPKEVTRTKKIFVGGLSSSTTVEDIRAYFKQFGAVEDVTIMMDRVTTRSRGFAFVTFESESTVEEVVNRHFHEINSKMVETKKAQPKEVMAATSTALMKNRAMAQRYMTEDGEYYLEIPADCLSPGLAGFLTAPHAAAAFQTLPAPYGGGGGGGGPPRGYHHHHHPHHPAAAPALAPGYYYPGYGLLNGTATSAGLQPLALPAPRADSNPLPLSTSPVVRSGVVPGGDGSLMLASAAPPHHHHHQSTATSPPPGCLPFPQQQQQQHFTLLQYSATQQHPGGLTHLALQPAMAGLPTSMGPVAHHALAAAAAAGGGAGGAPPNGFHPSAGVLAAAAAANAMTGLPAVSANMPNGTLIHANGLPAGLAGAPNGGLHMPWQL